MTYACSGNVVVLVLGSASGSATITAKGGVAPSGNGGVTVTSMHRWHWMPMAMNRDGS
jgi:hypothetical protein